MYRNVDLFGVAEEPVDRTESGSVREVAEGEESSPVSPAAAASKPSQALTSASQALSSVPAPLPKDSVCKDLAAPEDQGSAANVQSDALDSRTSAVAAYEEDPIPSDSERPSNLNSRSKSAADSGGRFWQVCSFVFVYVHVCGVA